jgi:hypothetical protein
VKLAVYHHVYAVGDWRRILREHVAELRSSGLFDGGDVLHVGLVGPKAARQAVRNWSRGRVYMDVFAEADRGWEQVTLGQLHADAVNDCWDAALYLHTKGITTPGDLFAEQWRRSMLRGTVTWWRHCVQALQDGADAVGCHWLEPGKHPWPVDVPYFGGNFWWASREFLARCDPPSGTSRHEAEVWLGRNSPGQVVDLAPGWPDPETLLTEESRDAVPVQ